jgi:hypothetical protein
MSLLLPYLSFASQVNKTHMIQLILSSHFNIVNMTPECQSVQSEKFCRDVHCDNGSVGMFPQQRIGLWKPKRSYKINTRFRSNKHAQNNRGTVGVGDLYLVPPEVIKGGDT